MQIRRKIKLMIISQIKIKWRAVFLRFGSDDMEYIAVAESRGKLCVRLWR